ncbi:MAG: DeoR/GlpR family DNA-binding transcription regulator [Terrimicrobiaceae bacterium]
MKVPLHIVQARREKLEKLLASERYLPISEVRKQLGISEATARRDLAALEREGRITRTRGGALGEFNDRFPSYSERQRRGARSKSRMAAAALTVLRPGGTYFFDSGTTVSYLADALAEKPPGPMRILTVNLPAAEVLAAHREIEVHLTGGQMLPRQSVLLGGGAIRSIEGWTFDAAFLSAEGMDGEGLWNSQLSIVAHQHAVVRRARKNIFLMDRTKANHRAAHFLLPWGAVDCVLSDATRETMAGMGREALQAHWLPGNPVPFDCEVDSEPDTLPVHYL